MCSRGVFQLQKLTLFFCDWGGSSTGVRNLLISQQFNQFRSKHPHIQFEFIRKRNHHPFVSSTYLNGYTKDIPLRNLEQPEILEHFQNVNNSFGRKSIIASGKKVINVKQSIQGKWQPNMWNTYPRVEMQQSHHIQYPTFQTKEIIIKPKQNRKSSDFTNRIGKVKPTKSITSHD